MVKLDKIYTRGGDKGYTSLGDGTRVKKNNQRVLVYGELDEANAVIGMCINYCQNLTKSSLQIIQNDLFDLGADICVPESFKKKNKLSITESQVTNLEEMIDKMNNELDSLSSFILPGGTKSSALLHLARCVVRRAERNLVILEEAEKINSVIAKYINRLSDFLFVAARYENKKIGDILWKPGKSQN